MISQTDSNSQASSKSGRKDKRYVAISIDVEGVHGRNPFGQMAYGDIGEEEDWGALKIARVLKENGLLTRDSREVERKKPGRAKARRSYQFSKR